MISEEIRNESLIKLKEGKELGDKQIEVLEALRVNDLTDKEISARTGLSLSCVNGRRNELVDMGFVCSNGSVYNEVTKTRNTVWTIVLKGEQSTQEKIPQPLPFSFMKKLEVMIWKLKRQGNERQLDIIKEILND